MEGIVSITFLVTNSCLALPPQSMSQLQSLLPAFNIISPAEVSLFIFEQQSFYLANSVLIEDKITPSRIWPVNAHPFH